MTADEEQRLRARLVWALGRLSPDQRDLLRRVYGECQSLVSVSEELTVAAKLFNGDMNEPFESCVDT